MQKDTEMIKEQFLALQTRQDVADILGIEEKSLRYFLYAIRPDKMYTQFIIKKKNGDNRYINAPDKRLRNIQRKLANILNCVYKVKPAAHGFAIGKDIVTNANNHVRRKYVFNMDLENFFDQIHFGRVRGMLMKPPYSLGSEAALVIAQIACYQGRLPQGAPTSPILTNMICAPLDTQLTKLAKKYNLCYSRYADDITFSSKGVFPKEITYTNEDGVHIGIELQNILTKNSFNANPNKTRIYDYRKRQEVTGLVVNRIVNLRRNYIKKIRAILFHCEKEGIYETAKMYVEKGNCQNSKIIGMIKNETEETQKDVIEWFKMVLKGKIGYIKQVKGKNHLVFIKYAKQLNDLFNEEIFHIGNKIDLINLIEKSVFVLESENGQGSGFIVKNIGLLTNYHVTEDGETYEVRTCKNEKVCIVSNEINLLWGNQKIDYACFKFGSESEEALELGSSRGLEIGSSVTVAAYPDYVQGNSPEIQDVKIISKRSFFGQCIYTISGRIVHGASGGVVLDGTLKVVGIIRCGSPTFEDAEEKSGHGFIPIDDVINDLRINGSL